MPSEVQQITRVLIWNLERQQWWLPSKGSGTYGYTPRLDEAGQYWIVDALEILRWANITEVCDTIVPINTLGQYAQEKLKRTSDQKRDS